MTDAVLGAIRYQRLGFGVASLASPLYATVLDAAMADVDRGGPCAAVLAEVPADLDPITDAVILRYLGAAHRLVLTGQAPALARWFPTAGGRFDPAGSGEAADAVGADFVAVNEEHHDALVAGLREGVQTNEVGRSAALAVGFTALLRELGRPLRLLELGASAGLNLRWDQWRYESGRTAWGDEDAPLRFGAEVYEEPGLDISAPPAVGAGISGGAVVGRRGCDRSPIDPTTDAGRLLLRSFVWPDQTARHARLDAALAVAAEVPAPVDEADAATWLAEQLAPESSPSGVTTVVYHSVVWQYLPPATRDGVVAVLEAAGAAASADAPVAWLRMEPGPRPTWAELRLRTWPSPAAGAGDGEDRLLALSGFHGQPVRRSDGFDGFDGFDGD